MKSIIAQLGLTGYDLIERPIQPVKESAIVNHMKRKCTKHGVDIQRLKGQNGWFDYMIFWSGGKPSLVETKKPKGGRYEPLQLRTHAKYRKLGYDVAVLLTKPAVDILFERHGFT